MGKTYDYNEMVNMIGLAEDIKDEWMSGSGFDSKPEFEFYTKRDEIYLRVKHAYHTMTEYGMYDGWVEFTVDISLWFPSSTWKLTINGKQSHYYARKYQLREYFIDTIHYIIDKAEKKAFGK